MFTFAWAILGTLIMAGIIGWSAWRTHGKPVENLTVVAVDRQLSSSCNYYRHIQLHHWVVLWRSDDPPAGRPRTFSTVECSSWAVGRTARLVRLSADAQTEVLAPEDGRPIEYVQGYAVAALVLLPILFLGRLAWTRFAEPWLARVRSRRRAS